ncbi:MAG: 6-oxocyclohex-1-ene-1-carbonyl-CoA hydratase [Myxococcota bacterium]
MVELKNHDLVPDHTFRHIRYEEKPVKTRDGKVVEGLHQVWISLDNEKQLNSYTTSAVKDVILAFRRASVDRRAVAVVFTGVGSKAFCTGGNTAEYATYYANRPLEYLQYMRLFNDMVTGILQCDKPVICRVNGMRIAGGQEIGMACDFSVAGDHARFGQAGPIHGSAPDGGATDFLHLYVGYARAAESLSLCEPWSAHKAYAIGLINDVVPTHRTRDGAWIANPLVQTERHTDELGRLVYGEWKKDEAYRQGKAVAETCTIDLSRLDAAVDGLVTRLMYTFPDCTRRTLESLRKKKLEHWLANCESSRSWLALNMNTEAAAGFPAFHYGDRDEREVDFVRLRQRLAEGAAFDQDLVLDVQPASARRKMVEAARERK